MAKAKVLFLDDVGRHGRAGEVREVASGYARNYLFPRSLAVPATKDQLQRVKKIRRAAGERRVREQRDAEALAERLSGATVDFAVRASSSGRLYGSVAARQIAERLSEKAGTEIDRRAVELQNPIREPGTYEVRVRLPQHASATVTVEVRGEGPGGTIIPARAPVAEQAEPGEAPAAEAGDTGAHPEENAEEGDDQRPETEA